MDGQFAIRYLFVIGSDDSEIEECCGDGGALSGSSGSAAGGAGVYDGDVGENNGSVG